MVDIIFGQTVLETENHHSIGIIVLEIDRLRRFLRAVVERLRAGKRRQVGHSHCRGGRTDFQQGLGGEVHDDQRGKSSGEFRVRGMRGDGWRCYTDWHGGVASSRAVDEI